MDVVRKVAARPEEVTYVEAEPHEAGTTHEMSARPKVRPIQAGEFLRRFTSKRLLALDRDD
eukprot:7749934-Karenia_brevis.AAC.1